GEREDRHAAAAIFRRYVELPDAQLLGATLEALEVFRLELFAVGGLALNRDQLIVDEAPQIGFEDSQLFRQFEIHCLHAPSASSRHNTRTSTATAPAPAPAGFDALDRRSRAGVLALTIRGLISMSLILARWSRKKRPSPSAAASSAARSAALRPRNSDRRCANFSPSTMVLTSWVVTGSRRNAASATSSTSTPPEPTSSSGPWGGSLRAPTMAAMPDTISCTRKPSMRAEGCAARAEAASASAAACTASQFCKSSATPPTSVLCRMSRERIFSVTGKPMRSAAV